MKKTCFLILLSCFYFNNRSYAQNNSVSAGANGTGTGGSVSYSVGQISYVTKTSGNGSVSEGVQQPYEIFIITDLAGQEIDVCLNVYPNPAVDIITLEIRDHFSSLSYLLTDINGKLIFQNKVAGSKTLINCKNLNAGIYFLKVYNENEQLKNFKLIKNK